MDWTENKGAKSAAWLASVGSFLLTLIPRISIHTFMNHLGLILSATLWVVSTLFLIFIYRSEAKKKREEFNNRIEERFSEIEARIKKLEPGDAGDWRNKPFLG